MTLFSAARRAVLVLALSATVGLAAAVAASADKAAPASLARPGATSAAGGRIGFVGQNLFGRAEGEFRDWRVVEQSVDLQNPSASQVVIAVEIASIDTQNESRDEHLRTADFFDAAKFPVATVRGHSGRLLQSGKSERLRYAVQFDVDLHGVEKTLEGEVEIIEAKPLVVEGSFLIRRTDFGIGAKPSRWNPLSIDDEVPVTFRIAFK